MQSGDLGLNQRPDSHVCCPQVTAKGTDGTEEEGFSEEAELGGAEGPCLTPSL